MTTDGGSWYGADGTGDVSDGRYEPDHEWSDYLTGVVLSAPSNAFDDATATYADTTGGWTLDLSSYTFGTGSHDIIVSSGGANFNHS